MFKARKPRSKHDIPENLKRFKGERRQQNRDIAMPEEELKMDDRPILS